MATHAAWRPRHGDPGAVWRPVAPTRPQSVAEQAQSYQRCDHARLELRADRDLLRPLLRGFRGATAMDKQYPYCHWAWPTRFARSAHCARTAYIFAMRLVPHWQCSNGRELMARKTSWTATIKFNSPQIADPPLAVVGRHRVRGRRNAPWEAILATWD